jgi:tripartite-type tricarboxylate transporter receptor subunit TctC
MQAVYGDPKAKFDPRKFNWLGSINKQQGVCVTWHTAAVKTIEDARKQEVVVGAEAQNTTPAVYPRILNSLIGTKFKIVTGYNSGGLRLALERGEIGGICGFGWQTLQSSNADWIAKKQLNVLIQLGLVKNKDLPNVPLALDMLANDNDRGFFKLAVLTSAFGRPVLAPPGVPADRIKALQKAFDQTVRDPAFIDAAAKSNMSVDSLNGAQIESLLNNAYKASTDVKTKVAKYFGIGS